MNLLSTLLNLRLGSSGDTPDAACAITVVGKGPPAQHRRKHSSNIGALTAPEGGGAFRYNPFKLSGGGSGGVQDQCAGLELLELPLPVACRIWDLLADADKRNVRCVQQSVCSAFSRAVSSLQVTGREGFGPQDMRRLGSTFPDLNTLQLQLGPDACSSSSSSTSSSTAAAALLQELRGVRLPHLHTFVCDVKLKGDLLLAVCRFLVHTPSLRVLRLPNQRGCSAADQRLLCAVVEALPHLTHLDLGGAGSSRSGSNALSPSLMRRVTKLLPCLRLLSCNAAAVPDEQLGALEQLQQLQGLSICAGGSGRCLATALARCTQLTSLELQHGSLGGELEGCLAGMRGLQVLTLGLCPQLSDGIVQEVCGLQHLRKLSLPFPISAQHLASLAHLPRLAELRSFNHLELDVLGPAHDPLPRLTKLVASSIDSHGKSLAALFPALQSVYLRSCGDMEALALKGSGAALGVLVAGDCGSLTDEGFAALRTLRGLTRLQVDNAHQLSDLSFVAMFSSTMPALHHVHLSGCARITDTALQLLTASCRRLASITLAGCPQLSDKTLKRLAHCDHLASITLRACGGITAQGVEALVAAPQVKAVLVAGCGGVARGALRAARQGGKLRVVSDSEAGSSAGGRRVSDSSGRGGQR